MALVNLKGQVAFITGGSRGIGRVVAIELAKDGADVCVVARSKPDLDAVVEECKNHGVRAISIAADIKDLEEMKRAVETCVQELGSLSILVNNAGIFTSYNEPLERWLECVNINLISLMAITHYAIPHLAAHGRSSIIQICSIAGKLSLPSCAPYNASKFGVLGFSNSLFEEVREKGIKVCTLLPGMVRTDMTAAFKCDPEKMIQPEDIAAVVNFVAKFPTTACPSEIEIRPQRNPRVVQI